MRWRLEEITVLDVVADLSEGDILTAILGTPAGRIYCMAQIGIDGRTLRLDGLNIHAEQGPDLSVLQGCGCWPSSRCNGRNAMKQSFRERLERLGPVGDVGRNHSGSPATVTLTVADALARTNAILAALALARNGASLRAAKTAVERAIERGEAAIDLTMIESQAQLAAELQDAGFAAAFDGATACRIAAE